MYLFKLLIAFVISGSLVGNSVAMASAGLSSRLDGLVASGDVVLDDSSVGHIEPNLTAVENTDDVAAGEPLTIATVLAILLIKKLAKDAVKAGITEVVDNRVEEVANSEPESSVLENAKIGSVAAGKAIVDQFSPKELFGLKSEIEKYKTYANIASNMPEYTLNEIDKLSATLNAVIDYVYNSTSFNVGTIQSLSELVKGGEFTTSSALNYWTDSNARAGYSSFGSISSSRASLDNRFGFVHTGLGDNSDKGFMFQTVFPLKNSSAVFNARYNFVTTEFPQFLGSQFNDSFVIKIEDVASGATKTLASFNGSLNTLFDKNDPVVQNLPAQFLDAVASGGGQTGWVTKSSGSIALKSGGKYRIYINVRDVGDRVYDSALLIDKVSLR